MTAPVPSSWLTECIRCHLPAGGAAPDPVSLRTALEGRLTDTRKARGKRHLLLSLVSVLVAGVAAALSGPLAVAQAAAGWDQEGLAAHGCRISPRTGLRVPPSASMLDRLPKLLGADEFEAALSASLAAMALDPAIPAAYAAHRAGGQREKEERQEKRKRKPPAAESFREERQDGRFRPHPLHPWLDPAVTGDPGHVPARRAVAVDGKERKLAKAGGQKKVHLLAAVTHIPGLVIAQDRVAKSGKANEITHFKPLLAPLPLDDVLMNALPWETTPVAAATSEISRGRIETRTICVLPAPEDTGFKDARQALLIERYTTYKKKGQWHTRAEAVLYITSLAADETTPEDLLAHVRGHWRVEHAHWLRSPRRDLERRQIPHPHRKRTPDLVRPRQPRHHPVPHTRSNQLRQDPTSSSRRPCSPSMPRPGKGHGTPPISTTPPTTSYRKSSSPPRT